MKKIMSLGLVFILCISVMPTVIINAETYTPIYTVADLVAINNNLSDNYMLMNNIDLSGYDSWTALASISAPFQGVLNGNGYKILNMNISIETKGAINVGLFAKISGGEIFDLSIENATVSMISNEKTFQRDPSCVGLLAAQINNTKVSNCNTSGTISATGGTAFTQTGHVTIYAGGITGKSSSTEFFECANAANITARAGEGGPYTGGIAGYAESNSYFQGCGNSGTIDGASTYGYEVFSGGIIGYATNTNIKGCNNEGNIKSGTPNNTTTSANTGGICGYFTSGAIELSYNEGKISNTSSPIVVYNGGIVGRGMTLTISQCYNSSMIDSYSTSYDGNMYIGGIIGHSNNVTIADVYNVGTVRISNQYYNRGTSGGIIGSANGNTNVTNAYVITTFKNGGNNSGELVGKASARVNFENIYYISSLGKIVGQGTYNTSNVVCVNESEMKMEATYSGFDFKNIWIIRTGTYPTLRFNDYSNKLKKPLNRDDVYDTYYVTHSYPKKFIVFNDADKPLIPSDEEEEYKKELYAWVKEFGYEDILTEKEIEGIIKKYMPTTYKVENMYTRENKYTTKDIMRDIIMLNSTKKSIYLWEDDCLVPDSKIKMTDVDKRFFKILEGYSDYCNSLERNPVINALYTVLSTTYTHTEKYAWGKLKSDAYGSISKYWENLNSNEIGYSIHEELWNDIKLNYNTYRYDSLDFEDSAWKEFGKDITKSIVKDEVMNAIAEVCSENDNTKQVYDLITTLKDIGGFAGDGVATALAPYNVAYKLMKHVVDTGVNINKAYLLLTEYYFLNNYPELSNKLFDEKGNVTNDYILLSSEIQPYVQSDFLANILVKRLMNFDSLDSSVLFSINEKDRMAITNSAITMTFINDLNVNELRRSLVEFWVSSYTKDLEVKTNMYIPKGSSCVVTCQGEGLGDDYNQIAILDKFGVLTSQSSNVSIIDETDDIIIMELVGNYKVELDGAGDNVLISQKTERTSEIIKNVANLYKNVDEMNIYVNEEKIIAKDNDSGENVLNPISTLDDTANRLLADVDLLNIGYAIGDSKNNVKKSLVLASTGFYGSKISWESSNQDVITNNGEVIRSDEESSITMTATLTLNSKKVQKSFEVIVKPNSIYLNLDECYYENGEIRINAYALNELSFDKEGNVIVAVYKDKELINAHIEKATVISGEAKNFKFNYKIEEDENVIIKIMWWSDFENIYQLCEPIEQRIEKN